MSLLPNEKLNFSIPEISKKAYSADEINDRYERGELRIITEQGRYPLQNITEILGKNMKFDPEYQRRRVWTEIQKSKLIESFVINIPIPPVFLYEIDYSKYEVMDGLQRLTTLDDFYADKFKLKGLKIWPELNGYKYSELPEKIKQGIDRRYISTIVILKESGKTEDEEEQMKKFVFERLNTGGTKLTEQEERNALYNGKMNDLCIKIATENKVFQKLWNIKPVDLNLDDEEILPTDNDDFEDDYRDRKVYVRMEDIELVLRFFAYRQLETMPVTKVKDILDNYLLKANQTYSEELILKLEKLFNSTMVIIDSLFGDKAFLMYTKRKNSNFAWYPNPSKIIYDPIVILFSEMIHNKSKIAKIMEIKAQLPKLLEEFFTKNASEFNGRNNTKTDVLNRKKLFETFFNTLSNRP